MMNELIDYFTTRKELAKALNITRQGLKHFEDQGYLPARRAIQVEKMTDGAFKAEDLIKR